MTMDSFAQFARQAGPFLDPTAIGIVVGGTFAATLLRSPLADVGRALRALGQLGRRRWKAEAVLAQVDAMSRIARRHGVLTLDRSIIQDPDVAVAIAAIVDRADADYVRRLLEDRQQARDERHLGAINVWNAMAESAPAMGMIGTLIGLVKMFTTMNDPHAIGSAMAIALLTTLYGALLASLVALPVAGRLRALARAESIERRRLVAPLVQLAAREAPRTRPVAVASAEDQVA